MKKIGIALIMQESNSLNPNATTLAKFEPFGIAFGAQVIERFGKIDELEGFISGMAAWSQPAEPVGLVRAQGWSYGPMEARTRQWFGQRLREQLEAAGDLDGLLIALHGALVAEDAFDVDGLLLEEARSVLGPQVPIVATLDLHAHCTPRMMEAADALVAYHTIPHLDKKQTGRRAARVLERIFGGARPRAAWVRLPMITQAEPHDSFGPVLSPVFERLRAMEAEPGVLSAAIVMTQAWLDVPRLGWSTLVITDNDAATAERHAQELADMCWPRRLEMVVDYLSVPEAIEAALACDGAPVVLADGPDSTNTGACGDSVHVLKALAERPIPGGALTFMVDPEAVEHAESVGIGGKFDLAVGGKQDHVFSKPLPVRGEVLSIGPIRFSLNGHAGNQPIDMGLGAVVRIGDVTVLYTQWTGPGSSPKLYRSVGLEPRDFKIVVVKSPSGFRADYEPFAADIILTDSPGTASPRFERLGFRHINRPLWPIDEIDDWREVEWIRQERRANDEIPRDGRISDVE